MGQRLIGLPLELGLRAAKLGIRAARLPLEVLAGLAGRGGGDDDGASAQAAPSRPAPVRVRGDGSPPAGTTPGAAERAAAATPARPAEPAAVDGGPVDPGAPAHVSEEPDLVGEFAEAGAEEGAHAEVEVAEPWEGYARMTARDIEQRLATATTEEVAVVQLFESAHKARQSVLRAAQRRLGQQDAERRRPR